MSEKINYQELQQQQIDGEVKTIKANKNSEYEIPELEKDRIHIRLTRSKANDATQSYETQSRIESLSVQDFEQMAKTSAFAASGWPNQEIIHDPRDAKKDAKSLESSDALKAEYATLFGEEPADTVTNAEMKDKIEAKKAELEVNPIPATSGLAEPPAAAKRTGSKS